MDRGQLQNDPEVAMRAALDGRQAVIWTALPGIVTKVNWDEETLEVQPAIQGSVIDENGKVVYVNYPKLIHVPIQWPKAGGFALTFPIAAGDEVLIHWACRAIDSWWQSGGIQKPVEVRMHDLSDGFAAVGISSIPNVFPSINTTGVQLRNKLGTSYIEISADGKVKVVSASEVDITAPSVKVTGNMDLTGNLAVTGNISGTGTMTGPGGISLTTHKHTGVTTGGGTSGGPTP